MTDSWQKLVSLAGRTNELLLQAGFPHTNHVEPEVTCRIQSERYVNEIFREITSTLYVKNVSLPTQLYTGIPFSLVTLPAAVAQICYVIY